MIRKKVFPATGNPVLAEAAAETAMNDWLSNNTDCRVINIETIMEAGGGDGVIASRPISLNFVGLRVWYENEGQ